MEASSHSAEELAHPLQYGEVALWGRWLNESVAGGTLSRFFFSDDAARRRSAQNVWRRFSCRCFINPVTRGTLSTGDTRKLAHKELRLNWGSGWLMGGRSLTPHRHARTRSRNHRGRFEVLLSQDVGRMRGRVVSICRVVQSLIPAKQTEVRPQVQRDRLKLSIKVARDVRGGRQPVCGRALRLGSAGEACRRVVV